MVKPAMVRERLSALREAVSRIENEHLPGLARSVKADDPAGFRCRDDGAVPRLPFGISDLDHVLEGGFPLAGLVEIRTEQTRDAGAACGFVLALTALLQRGMGQAQACLPVLWIGQPMASAEAGQPYAVGLQAHGLDVGLFLLCMPKTLEDALWAAETALGTAAFSAVIIEIRGNPDRFGLSESRRLHLRARAGGLPLVLLRQAGVEEASSALFRFRLRPAPSRLRSLPDGSLLPFSMGDPVFHLSVEKSRIQAATDFFMEWNAHDHVFRQHDVTDVAVFPDSTDPVARLSIPAGRSVGTQAVGKPLAFQRAS